MDKKVKIHHEKLGELSYSKGPKTIHCWCGDIDNEVSFCIILNDPDLETAAIDFIVSIIQNYKIYLEKSLEFIKSKLDSNWELFGVGKEDRIEYLSEGDIPVYYPQFTFSEKCEWTIHYMECYFPICYPYGMGVGFNGEQPTTIENILDCEIIEDEE